MNYQFKISDNRVECTLEVKKGLKFKGVAKCHPSDYYTSGTGKRIAALRADKKLAIWEIKQLEKMIASNTKYLEEIDNEIIQKDKEAEIYAARLARVRESHAKAQNIENK